MNLKWPSIFHTNGSVFGMENKWIYKIYLGNRTLIFVLFCLVVYDSCPQSYAGGIWWPRTLFDTISEQDCPEGSFGKTACFSFLRTQ